MTSGRTAASPTQTPLYLRPSLEVRPCLNFTTASALPSYTTFVSLHRYLYQLTSHLLYIKPPLFNRRHVRGYGAPEVPYR